MRTELQNEIAIIRQQLFISTTDLKSLSLSTNWHKLEEQIYQRFCKISGESRPIWLWENFKHGYQGIDLNVYIPSILDQLIPPDELVWFMASDGSDFLFYEGKVRAIQKVVEESAFLDEYYLISKKYEWLFCVNHHDILIGTGEFAIQQIRQFLSHSPELVIQAYPA